MFFQPQMPGVGYAMAMPQPMVQPQQQMVMPGGYPQQAVQTPLTMAAGMGMPVMASASPVVCWACGQPGHTKNRCPHFARLGPTAAAPGTAPPPQQQQQQMLPQGGMGLTPQMGPMSAVTAGMQGPVYASQGDSAAVTATAAPGGQHQVTIPVEEYLTLKKCEEQRAELAAQMQKVAARKKKQRASKKARRARSGDTASTTDVSAESAETSEDAGRDRRGRDGPAAAATQQRGGRGYAAAAERRRSQSRHRTAAGGAAAAAAAAADSTQEEVGGGGQRGPRRHSGGSLAIPGGLRTLLRGKGSATKTACIEALRTFTPSRDQSLAATRLDDLWDVFFDTARPSNRQVCLEALATALCAHMDEILA